MPDTAVDLDFAGGKYRFWLPMPQIVAIERGPAAHRHEGYPRSIFTMYEQIGAGLAPTQDGGTVFLGGGSALIGDVRNIILQGLIGGNHGMIDGEEQPVGPTTAARLIEEHVYPVRPISEAMALAWAILHSAIFGIDLKKKDETEAAPKSRSRSAKAK
ncbi:hypothetical protein I5E68_07060 [Novosphingobium sp. YJ-S2-02]|uniref:Uncharacterized protein n=1 Tax=Novosphingobium aureum TaxID=2792964 RepID=A0A931HC24_9SPHN|nr:hypothetical protein [Novosphingobium aureum]MBH0112709.1 hypothetical protein [Novosphingobium aureum]